MNSENVNWLWAVVLLPVLVGIFKSELGKLFTIWNVYRLRAFDSDGNPGSPDNVQILNSATGKWGNAIIEKYVFSLSSRRRGVYLLYPDGGREKVGYILWNSFRKRTPPVNKI